MLRREPLGFVGVGVGLVMDFVADAGGEVHNELFPVTLLSLLMLVVEVDIVCG